jgi:class 3 adenylate cyclase
LIELGGTAMGLYMDRHDLTGTTTATEVAAAHLSDLEAQERHGVKFSTYWFDYERQATFCLVEAPSAEAVQAAHRDSHGMVANEVIPVEQGAVERFLGSVEDPSQIGREAESAFRTILFTDLEGSTELTQRLGDEGAMRLLRIHDEIIRRELERENGREVKHTGDGIMASFSSVQRALAAAVQIQKALGEHTAAHPESPLRVRLGISAGEPVTEGEDLFGAAVQLAARLCDLAHPGTIVVSGVIRDLAIGKTFDFGPLRSEHLKGFPEPVSVCELSWSGNG